MATTTDDIGSGLDYATPAAWNAGTDVDLGGVDIYIGQQVDDVGTYTDFWITAATNTGASAYRQWRARADVAYDPVADTGVEVVAGILTFSEDYVRLGAPDGAVKLTFGTAGGDNAIKATANNVWIENIIAVDDGGDVLLDSCIEIQGTDSKVLNCIVYSTAGSTSVGSGIIATSSATGIIANCLAHGFQKDSTRAPLHATGTGSGLEIRNCAAWDAHASANALNFGSATHTNNASDDSSATGTDAITSFDPDDEFTDWANDDYTLESDSQFIDAGFDVSSDNPSDFAGTTWGATLEIGAYNYAAASSTDIYWSIA